jgi:hypothetical protein
MIDIRKHAVAELVHVLPVFADGSNGAIIQHRRHADSLIFWMERAGANIPKLTRWRSCVSATKLFVAPHPPDKAIPAAGVFQRRRAYILQISWV